MAEITSVTAQQIQSNIEVNPDQCTHDMGETRLCLYLYAKLYKCIETYKHNASFWRYH